MSTGDNVRFEAIYSDQVRRLLDRVSEAEYRLLDRSIRLLEQDPYPDPEHITTLVIPHRRVYHDAFACDGWAIAFHVEDNVFVAIDEIGRDWPPVDPMLRGR